MCLITNKKAEILTAKEDIPCFKFLYKGYNEELEQTLYSVHGEYVQNKLVRLRKQLKRFPLNGTRGRLFYTNEGFHSYDERAIKDTRARLFHGEHYLLYKCIIPKGAKYYEGYHNTRRKTGYVSTSLKVIEYYDEKYSNAKY